MAENISNNVSVRRMKVDESDQGNHYKIVYLVLSVLSKECLEISSKLSMS